VPDATAERLRECLDEFGGDLPGGYYVFDVAVKVDDEGRVIDVQTMGVPHADLAGCTRQALRAMTVPEDLLRLRRLRLPASPAPANEQTPAERGLVGNPGLLVAVVVVLADLIIEAAPVAVAIAASVEITGEIAEVARKKKDSICTAHLKNCLMSDLVGKRGEHWRATLCHACFKQCRPNNEWPKKPFPLGDELVSCQY